MEDDNLEFSQEAQQEETTTEDTERGDRFNYLKRNSNLVEALYKCDIIRGLTYEELCKILEEKGECIAGLRVKIERGIMLDIIDHYNDTRFPSDRRFFMTRDGKELYESSEFLKYVTGRIAEARQKEN